MNLWQIAVIGLLVLGDCSANYLPPAYTSVVIPSTQRNNEMRLLSQLDAAFFSLFSNGLPQSFSRSLFKQPSSFKPSLAYSVPSTQFANHRNVTSLPSTTSLPAKILLMPVSPVLTAQFKLPLPSAQVVSFKRVSSPSKVNIVYGLPSNSSSDQVVSFTKISSPPKTNLVFTLPSRLSSAQMVQFKKIPSHFKENIVYGLPSNSSLAQVTLSKKISSLSKQNPEENPIYDLPFKSASEGMAPFKRIASIPKVNLVYSLLSNPSSTQMASSKKIPSPFKEKPIYGLPFNSSSAQVTLFNKTLSPSSSIKNPEKLNTPLTRNSTITSPASTTSKVPSLLSTSYMPCRSPASTYAVPQSNCQLVDLIQKVEFPPKPLLSLPHGRQLVQSFSGVSQPIKSFRKEQPKPLPVYGLPHQKATQQIYGPPQASTVYKLTQTLPRHHLVRQPRPVYGRSRSISWQNQRRFSGILATLRNFSNKKNIV